MSNRVVKVELGDRSYDIVVGNNILADVGELISDVIPLNKVFVVTDKNIAAAGHLEIIEKSLQSNDVEFHTIIIEPGEKSKSYTGIQVLLDSILEHSPERKVTLVALGGGVIGDLTGFAASILLRGVNFVQIPTTLLAMVDSSVGGKTGINTKYGKNLVGSFYQPLMVISDTASIETLPKREQLAGYAEIVKYGLIADAGFFEKLESSKDIVSEDFIIASCKAKAAIVAEDEKEAGKRALLNLGHTFGHALEAETGFSDKLLHGEAVAIGTVMAFKFSEFLGLCKADETERVEKHFSNVGLRTSPSQIEGFKFDSERILSHMQKDKKVENGMLTFILVNGIGKAFVEKGVESSKVLDFLNKNYGDAS